MVSPYRLMGYFFQIAGMLVMFWGFFNLVSGIQGTISHVTAAVQAQSGVLPAQNSSCDPQTDEWCGVDISQQGAVEQVFSRRTDEFILYLGCGLALLLIGLLLRAGGEIKGFFAGFWAKEKTPLPVGKMRKPLF